MEQQCPSARKLTYWRSDQSPRSVICSFILILVSSFSFCSPGARAGDIYITSTNGQGGFGLAGAPFIPRGVNYDVSATADGYHGQFDPCAGGRTYPACYGDGSQAEGNLRYIHGSDSGAVFSYNYVRVFLSSVYVNNGFTFTPGAGMAPAGTIPAEWLSNLADFLQRAKNNGLRVILTGEYAPANFTYAGLTCSDSGRLAPVAPCSSGENDIVFNPDYAAALGRFYAALIGSLSSPPYSDIWPGAAAAIMAVDMKNEIKVRSDALPLSDHTLTRLSIDNGVYDMSDAASRQALIDDLTKNFVLTVGNAIRAADPSRSILVEASVVTPHAQNGASGYAGAMGPTACDPANPWQCLFPLRSDIMALYGGVSFRDIHSYQRPPPYDEDAELASAGLVVGTANPVPLVMGEFGALRQLPGYANETYPDGISAVQALRQHMTASCRYGFSGWGVWTWRPANPADTVLFWTPVFSNADGTENNSVNGGLAIQAWPAVC